MNQVNGVSSPPLLCKRTELGARCLAGIVGGNESKSLKFAKLGIPNSTTHDYYHLAAVYMVSMAMLVLSLGPLLRTRHCTCAFRSRICLHITAQDVMAESIVDRPYAGTTNITNRYE